MAEKNIKISGIGDVTRADFVRAITDPDKFREFADQQGWGNKRRQLAWNSLHNYAQGVQNGEINEINDMHQIVDDTGVRTNKQEKYNWIGSKFDANGAAAAFMNQIAKGMQTDSKSANKSLKSIPSVTSYLNQQWFGSNNPDWELFQKNDTLTNGVYGIANRNAKIKEGLTKYKNELTTNGAQYNWDGVDKDALYKNLDAAIASSNVATYAPLGITSDYINNALATKDLSNTQEQSSENDQTSASQNPNSEGLTDEQLLSLDSNKDLADLAQANPTKRAEYIAQARERLANQITLSEQEAQRNTKAYQAAAAAYNAKLKQRQQQVQKTKEQQIQSQPQQVSFGRSSVKSMGKNTNTLTTADKVAIGAAVADFLASFTANPIANGAGTILTTGADLASDISHGASFGQAAGNAAMNLGMGLVGFIPGLGTATKAKKLKKILQVSSGAVQAYFIANNFKEGVKSLNKVLDGSASVQDYKNLIYGLQGVKGASNSVINTAKRRGAAKVIKELPDKFNAGEARYTFKSNGKETQRLTQAQIKELQEKGSEGVSDEIKQLLNGVVVKPSKTINTKLGVPWTKKQNPIEYKYKPKGEIQKLLDDLQIQSQKSSMWNPGRQDYLSMTSEHNWSLPSISIGLGKNSTEEVIKRAKPSKADIKSTKSSEYKQQQKQSRQQKASEVREAFSNTKSNNIKGHNKNTNLPHKQSNKKKKTSRDNNIKRRQDGGVLYDYEFLKSVHAFKQGGIIKAQGGVKLNNIWAGKNQDYGYNTYLNKYFNNQDVLSWMRTHYVGDNATKQYADYVMKNVNDRHTYGVNNYNNDSTYVANKGINTFNTGYQNSGNTLNYVLFGNNTKDYTDKKGVAYSLINFTRPDKALATGDSYNADPSKAYIDNALGLQTYSRVASLTDSGIKAGGFGDWGKYWKEQGNTGAYYYIAPGDTSGKGQWIPTNDKTLNGYQDFEAAPQETPKKDGSVTNPDIGKKSIFDKGKEYLSKLTSNPGNLYNAVETGKYLLANKATNDIFKIKAPNYVISPKHTSYQVMDNLAQQNAYHSKAAEIMNQTSRPLTSSGQLQTAAQQESMNNANKLYLQGNAERNTWLEGQKQQSYKAGLYNMESAVDTANANTQQAYKTRMLNEYQDPRDRARALATNRQNWINALEKFNIIDPYVERKNAQQQYGLAKAQWDYQNDANVLAAQQKYQQLLRQHQNDLNFNVYDTDEYRNLINAQKTAGAKYYNNMYQVYGISNPGFKYKKGGKFADISKFNTKEFYNTIRHSINTATKQSGDLSKLINTLFKKSNKK